MSSSYDMTSPVFKIPEAEAYSKLSRTTLYRLMRELPDLGIKVRGRRFIKRVVLEAIMIGAVS